jgi:PAS domain S-box-containing protein
MKTAVTLDREADRLEALHACAIVDTQPEADFDDLVAVAAAVADAPQACIAFVDESRWWVKAWVGHVPRELPRDSVLCAEALASAEPMVVDDVRAHPRFALHPALEADPQLRFYAALPLVLDGCLAIGALCVSDRRPRALRPAQLAALQRVARQIVRLLSFRRHATVLAAAHESLAIGEAQYRLLAETATDAIVTVNEEGRILFANPAVERLFGYLPEEVVGEPLSMLAPERDRPSHDAVFDGIRAGRLAVSVSAARLTGQRKDGRELPLELSCGEGRVGHQRFFTGILRDVSDRHATEHALIEARERAVESSRLKSEFLANMSHEIRTPMNGVTGMLELLLEDHLPEEQRKRVHVALGSAQALLTIINDILDLSKIEAGKLDLVPEWVDVRALVDDVVGLLRPLGAEKHVAVEGACASSVPARVFVDGGRLRQVLMNLAGNAVKFTDVGHVSVSVSASVASAAADAVRLTCTVADTGVGIPSEQIPLVFEQFRQLDGPAAHRSGGTGLGLSICRKLVDLMRGSIHVSSQPGRGSTFWFEIDLPCAAQERRPAPVTRDEPTDVTRAKGVRVLLVEDNPVNRQFALAVLKSVGAVVTVATNGAEAVQIAADAAHDVILMDCQMPVMDGYEATRRIRGAGSAVPIIALTANAMEGDRDRCTAAGMDDYLAKPIRPDVLRAAVAGLARRADDAERLALHAEVGVDAKEITARIGGDSELLVDISRLFVTHSTEMLQALHDAAAARDAAAVSSAAHAIKGSIGNFTQGPAFEMARTIEKAADAGDLDAACALLSDFDREVGKLCRVLDGIVASIVGAA